MIAATSHPHYDGSHGHQLDVQARESAAIEEAVGGGHVIHDREAGGR